ncbi:30S ribosomal protein S13 [Candidatus Woesearchaeota archaeon]|nr:30S ribosomal protein S13 [Candidatus Woesearchaeota archaeon]
MSDVKQIVRIVNTDILGGTKIFQALTKIHGVSYNFSNAVCNHLGLEKTKAVGSFENEEIKKIEEVVKNPLKYGLPRFIINRRADIETGEDKHLLGSDLKLRKEFDVKLMKKIKTYKGIRHALGLPVRGQGTKAHFRTGKSIGVKKAKKSKKS